MAIARVMAAPPREGGQWQWLGRRTGFLNDLFPAGLVCTHGWRAGYMVVDDRLLKVQDSGDQPTDSTTKY